MKTGINLYEPTEDENTLPICFPPPIKAYLPISIISNIITANKRNCNWLMYNFIQLYKYKIYDKIESFPVQWFMYFEQAEISSTCINQKIIDIGNINLVEDIIKWIDNKNYVVVYLNEGILPQTRLYQRKNILHSQFIFGYNRLNKTFKVMNFSKDNDDISIIDIPFKDLSNSFYDENTMSMFKGDQIPIGLKGMEFCIYLIRYKDEVKELFNNNLCLDIIKENLKQYIECSNSSYFNNYFTGYMEGSWGIDIYNEIIILLQQGKVDSRVFCLLFEHKKYMKMRIALFDELISEKYEEIVNETDILKGLCFKYQIKKTNDILVHMIKILEDIKFNEVIYLKTILNI